MIRDNFEPGKYPKGLEIQQYLSMGLSFEEIAQVLRAQRVMFDPLIMPYTTTILGPSQSHKSLLFMQKLANRISLYKSSHYA